MAHIHREYDRGGDLVELTYLCSDACHKAHCERSGGTYEGWDGCHELHSPEHCANCGTGLDWFDSETETVETAPHAHWA